MFFAGVFLAFLGTLTYSLSQDWNPVDALYFSILYQLIGIGILVEILRRLGLSFVEIRRQESQPDQRSS